MTSDRSVKLAKLAFLPEYQGFEDKGDKGISEVVRFDPAKRGLGSLGKAVCSIGAFDGIHRGHRYLFTRLLNDAKDLGVASVIVTFDPDPDEIFKPVSQQHKILSNEDRIELLRHFGADYVLVIPFTSDFAANTAQGFVDDYLRVVFEPASIHVGSDFRLGSGNEGSVESLKQLGTTRGFNVYGHELKESQDQVVSATRIRNLLSEGALDDANDLLCRPHYVRGHVGPGRHQGTEFGFPTANVHVEYPYAMPAEGVYAGFVAVDQIAYPAAINVGAPKTFDAVSDITFLEANLLGYKGNLYGKDVRVAFTRRLRPQRKFNTLEELIAVVTRNIDWVANNLGNEGIELDR